MICADVLVSYERLFLESTKNNNIATSMYTFDRCAHGISYKHKLMLAVRTQLTGTTMTAIWLLAEAQMKGFDTMSSVRKWPTDIGVISAPQASYLKGWTIDHYTYCRPIFGAT